MKHVTVFLFALLIVPINTSHSQCEWTVQRGPDARTPVCIQFVDSLHGWAGRVPQFRDPLLRTTNGGRTWDTVIFSYDIGAFTSISFIDSLRGWGVEGSLNRLSKTIDGGLTWIIIKELPFSQPGFGTIQFVDNVHGFAVGADSIFPWTRTRRTTDGGYTWSSASITTSAVYYRMKFVDSLRGWCVGEQIYATTDGGVSWQKQTYDSVHVITLYGVAFVDTQEGWCCSNRNGWIIHTTDGGQNWSNQALIQTPNGITMTDIAFIDRLNGWVFGSRFYQGSSRELIYRTTDGGNSWYQESIDLAGYLGRGTATDLCHAWALSYGDGSILGLGDITSVGQSEISVPETMSLSQNYPNPYNPVTTIHYRLTRREHVVFKVFDQLGHEVRVLVDEVKEAGDHFLQFDASRLSSGVYFFNLSAGSDHTVKKSILLK